MGLLTPEPGPIFAGSLPASAEGTAPAGTAPQRSRELDGGIRAVSANRADFLYLTPSLWPALPSIAIGRLEDQRRGGLKLREAMRPYSFDTNLLKLQPGSVGASLERAQHRGH